MAEKSTLERAFELARNSSCTTMLDIRRKLAAEGYTAVDQHMEGASIKKQLLAIMHTRSRHVAR